jgi:hypothetical protein
MVDAGEKLPEACPIPLGLAREIARQGEGSAVCHYEPRHRCKDNQRIQPQSRLGNG